jgi:hypothetical protein
MTIRVGRIRWLLVGALVLLAVGIGSRIWQRAESSGTPAPPETAVVEPTRALPPAARLKIRVSETTIQGEALLDSDADAWKGATATGILLSRTPRIYQTEAPLDRPAPACEVRALRSGSKLYLYLTWDDATKNAPEAPPARTGEGGIRSGSTSDRREKPPPSRMRRPSWSPRTGPGPRSPRY